jgi:hypothetical protein
MSTTNAAVSKIIKTGLFFLLFFIASRVVLMGVVVAVFSWQRPRVGRARENLERIIAALCAGGKNTGLLAF